MEMLPENIRNILQKLSDNALSSEERERVQTELQKSMDAYKKENPEDYVYFLFILTQAIRDMADTLAEFNEKATELSLLEKIYDSKNEGVEEES